MFLWCARLTWALLPIATGDALADALDGWATAPAFVAAIFLWGAWAIGLVALLAPRPWGVTALRVAGPSAVVVTVLAAPSAGGISAALGITAAVVAAGFALSAPVARAAGNALAYGDESRFPLRIPPALKYSLVPVAVVVVSVGVTAGPLLLADERYILGGIALVIGLPAAAFFARSLHALSRRWLVLVPAGRRRRRPADPPRPDPDPARTSAAHRTGQEGTPGRCARPAPRHNGHHAVDDDARADHVRPPRGTHRRRAASVRRRCSSRRSASTSCCSSPPTAGSRPDASGRGDAAAEDDVAVVERDDLTRSDTWLRLGEDDAATVEPSRHCRAVRAPLCRARGRSAVRPLPTPRRRCRRRRAGGRRARRW